MRRLLFAIVLALFTSACAQAPAAWRAAVACQSPDPIDLFVGGNCGREI